MKTRLNNKKNTTKLKNLAKPYYLEFSWTAGHMLLLTLLKITYSIYIKRQHFVINIYKLTWKKWNFLWKKWYKLSDIIMTNIVEHAKQRRQRFCEMIAV